VTSLLIALIVFVGAFASALVGMAVRLPDHHRDQDSYSGLLKISDTRLRNVLVQLSR
jgi:hypothetical protein